MSDVEKTSVSSRPISNQVQERDMCRGGRERGRRACPHFVSSRPIVSMSLHFSFPPQFFFFSPSFFILMSFASSVVSRGFSLLILFLPLVTGTTDSIPFKSLLIIVCSNIFKQSGNKLFLMGTFCYFQQISIEMHENSRQGLKPIERRNTAVSNGLCGNVLFVAWRSNGGGKGGWRGLTPQSELISKSNPGSIWHCPTWKPPWKGHLLQMQYLGSNKTINSTRLL